MRRRSGRGFDSPHLHQKRILCASDGADWFRQGEIVEKAARKATDVIRAKSTNANEDVYAVRMAA
jgi:hypothetical protein